MSNKKSKVKKDFKNPKKILEMMGQFVKSGDVSSVTDLIVAYYSNNPKYKSKGKFAKAVGVSKGKLDKVISHSKKAKLEVLFKSIEQIGKDAKVGK